MEDSVRHLILELQRNSPSKKQVTQLLLNFANSYKWRPCETLLSKVSLPTKQLNVAHLRVEHGLDNTAVLTFLPLDHIPQTAIIETQPFSYNHGTDTHIYITLDKLIVTDNRYNVESDSNRQTHLNIQMLHSDMLDLNPHSSRSPDFKRAEEALLSHVFRVKKYLQSAPHPISNESFAKLINLAIFLRSIEDILLEGERRLFVPARLTSRSSIAHLEKDIRSIFHTNKLPSYLSFEVLAVLLQYSPEQRSIISEGFYHSPLAPYAFDFAYLTKHTLSRIFEKYISLLEFQRSSQMFIFEEEQQAIEYVQHNLGMVYTPEFIPAFFTRIIEKLLDNEDHYNFQLIDPSCGSGIFPRTFLERLTESKRTAPLQTRILKEAFVRLRTIDINEAACDATRLSMALLYLSFTGSLPTDDQLNVFEGDSISINAQEKYRLDSDEGRRIIATNPPFKRYEYLNEIERQNLKRLLGPSVRRPDLYMGIVKYYASNTKPHDIIAFVLPNSFCTSADAHSLRHLLSNEFDIVCFIDLAAIKVFQEVNKSIVLIVAIRRDKNYSDRRPAVISQVIAETGMALAAVADNKPGFHSSSFRSSIVEQEYFESKSWMYLSAAERSLLDHLEQSATLGTIAKIGQGMNPGASIFVRLFSEVPSKEERELLYRPFVKDRDIRAFKQPETDYLLYYPYSNGSLYSWEKICEYENTRMHLEAHQEILRKRSAHRKEWWALSTKRREENIFQPKILMPYMFREVRAGVDLKGIYAVSRSPVVIAPSSGAMGMNQKHFLMFLLALFNSTLAQWYLRAHSGKGKDNFSRLEVRTLKRFPLPSRSELDSGAIEELFSISQKALKGKATWADYDQLNGLVWRLYGVEDLKLSI